MNISTPNPNPMKPESMSLYPSYRVRVHTARDHPATGGNKAVPGIFIFFPKGMNAWEPYTASFHSWTRDHHAPLMRCSDGELRHISSLALDNPRGAYRGVCTPNPKTASL